MWIERRTAMVTRRGKPSNLSELLNLYAGCNLPVSVEEEDSDADFATFESIESEEEPEPSLGEIVFSITRVLHWARRNPECNKEEKQTFLKIRNLALNLYNDGNDFDKTG